MNIQWKLNSTMTNWKNGQILLYGLRRFVMANAVKKWANFSKLDVKYGQPANSGSE